MTWPGQQLWNAHSTITGPSGILPMQLQCKGFPQAPTIITKAGLTMQVRDRRWSVERGIHGTCSTRYPWPTQCHREPVTSGTSCWPCPPPGVLCGAHALTSSESCLTRPRLCGLHLSSAISHAAPSHPVLPNPLTSLLTCYIVISLLLPEGGFHDGRNCWPFFH